MQFIGEGSDNDLGASEFTEELDFTEFAARHSFLLSFQAFSHFLPSPRVSEFSPVTISLFVDAAHGEFANQRGAATFQNIDGCHGTWNAGLGAQTRHTFRHTH